MAVVTACQPTAGPTQPTSTTSTSVVITSTTSTIGTTVTTSTTTTTIPPSPVFQASVSDVTAEQLGHSYTPDCPVTLEDLVSIDLVHWGFDGEIHDGAIVVARSEADGVIAVFAGLFDLGYPIQSVIPIGALPEGVEEEDPDYNNTSALHCRLAVGSTRWSEHAKGMAIDINPLLNPYLSATTLWPPNSERYLDRSLAEPGMIEADGAVVSLFAENGWQWGGNWTSIRDYHHFSTSGR